jgi:hypothetical protein
VILSCFEFSVRDIVFIYLTLSLFFFKSTKPMVSMHKAYREYTMPDFLMFFLLPSIFYWAFNVLQQLKQPFINVHQFTFILNSSIGRHLKRYSVISITPPYVFASSQNTLILLGSVIASIIYRSRHIGAVFASITVITYFSKFTDQHHCFC